MFESDSCHSLQEDNSELACSGRPTRYRSLVICILQPHFDVQ
jgi:hypothetical protein